MGVKDDAPNAKNIWTEAPYMVKRAPSRADGIKEEREKQLLGPEPVGPAKQIK